MPDSIRESVALAREVGWPDTESDWVVMHEGAHVVGAWVDGALVGQGALGCYGTAGTIAKMIVRPTLHRMGVGGRILESLLAEAEIRSISTLGLVATPMGRPLYARAGFTPVGDVVGMSGVATKPSLKDTAWQIDEGMNPDEVVRFDSHRLGCSRDGMLRARYREAIAFSAIKSPDEVLCGYAMASAQGAHSVIGPVLADSEALARALVASVLQRVTGQVRIDVPGDQLEFLSWLGSLGFVEQKRRPEMARGCARLPWQVPARFALAAQAWG